MFRNLLGPADGALSRAAASTQTFDRYHRVFKPAKVLYVATMPFIYSGFHDKPLAFVVRHGGAQYLFWRGFFDDSLADYPRTYEVYRLPELPNDVIKTSWVSLPGRAIGKVGSVPLDAIVFDPTNRRWIDSSVLEGLLVTSSSGGPL